MEGTCMSLREKPGLLEEHHPLWGASPGSEGKQSACNAGDRSLIPASGRSPREGNGYPLQYCCLENSMDRGAWWAISPCRSERVGTGLSD